MRILITLLLCAVALLQITRAQGQVGTAVDEAAIRAILDARNAAYNRHDAKAMAAVYASDVDLVTGEGRYLKGRAELERYYTDLFNGANKGAVVTIDRSNVRFVTADVALLDIDGTVTRQSGGTARNHATLDVREAKWQVGGRGDSGHSRPVISRRKYGNGMHASPNLAPQPARVSANVRPAEFLTTRGFR